MPQGQGTGRGQQPKERGGFKGCHGGRNGAEAGVGLTKHAAGFILQAPTCPDAYFGTGLPRHWAGSATHLPPPTLLTPLLPPTPLPSMHVCRARSLPLTPALSPPSPFHVCVQGKEPLLYLTVLLLSLQFGAALRFLWQVSREQSFFQSHLQ